MTNRRVYREVLLIAAVVLVSAAYAFYYHDRPRIDAAGYDNIGWNLARGFGYVEDIANSDRPELDWGINRVGPGYEFFLAGVYSLFGHTIWLVWILHALLRGVSVWLVMRIAEKMFPACQRVWLVAGILFGFSPDLIIVGGLLLTETLFLFLLVAFFYTTILLLEKKLLRYAILDGFLFAAAILTRPTALVLYIAVLCVLGWRKQWRYAFAVFIIPFIFVGSWSYFMSHRYGVFMLTTGVGGYDLWVGNDIASKGGFEKTDEQLRARYSMSVAQLDAFSKKKYFEFIKTHPLRFIELQIRKAALYFSLARPSGFWVHLLAYPMQRFLTLVVSFVWTLALFTLGLCGAYLMLKERRDSVSRLFLVFIVLIPTSVIPIIVETRYRYPLYPLLALSSAYFIFSWKNSKRVFATVATILCVVTAYDVFANFADISIKVNSVAHIFREIVK